MIKMNLHQVPWIFGNIICAHWKREVSPRKGHIPDIAIFVVSLPLYEKHWLTQKEWMLSELWLIKTIQVITGYQWPGDIIHLDVQIWTTTHGYVTWHQAWFYCATLTMVKLNPVTNSAPSKTEGWTTFGKKLLLGHAWYAEQTWKCS